MHEDEREVSRTSTVLLWLFVVNLGVALGAGLYEARIVVPEWIDASAQSPEWRAEVARHHDTGLRFWVGVTTIPLTLLTLANLGAAWRAPRGLRPWWLGASATALADRALTFGYFVPTMVRLMRAESSPAAVSAAIQWTQLNHLRHAILLAALLAALKAFSLLYARRGRLGGVRGAST